MPRKRRPTALLLLVLAAPAGASDTPGPSPDLGHDAGRRRDEEAFLALPPDRQEALRQLDRTLYEDDPASAARLRRALDRYARWRARLPEADRRRIDAAPDVGARLLIIKQIRERQWLARLPKAYRDELGRLKGPARADRVAEIRRQQRKERQAWAEAFPARLRGTNLPDTPADRALLDFALYELTPDERLALHLRPSDPAARERLKQEFIKRHPKEWESLQHPTK